MQANKLAFAFVLGIYTALNITAWTKPTPPMANALQSHR
jgi:hypothetical protein